MRKTKNRHVTRQLPSRTTMNHWCNFAEANKIKCKISRYYKLGNSYVCLKFSEYSFCSTKPNEHVSM